MNPCQPGRRPAASRLGRRPAARGRHVDRRRRRRGGRPPAVRAQTPNDSTRTPCRRLARSAIALANRGGCTFVSRRRDRQGGGAHRAILITATARAGASNGSRSRRSGADDRRDADVQRLRAYLATTGGRTTVRLPRDVLAIGQGRSFRRCVLTSRLRGLMTSAEGNMKQDISAPRFETEISRQAYFSDSHARCR